MGTEDKERVESKEESSSSDPVPSTKFRVSMTEQKQKVKQFTSASSASLHQNVSRGLRKVKNLGLLALERTANYVQAKKEKKNNG